MTDIIFNPESATAEETARTLGALVDALEAQDINTSIIIVHNDYYYVDSVSGDDNNDGSGGHPWKTISRVNGAPLVEGDHVLFKRGQIFVGQLTPKISGSAVNPIVYSSYGSGNRPIIDGIGSRAMVIVPGICRHIRFEGLHFYRSASGRECVKADSDNLYFYDCEVSKSSGMGMTSWSPDGKLIFNNTWDACIFHDNARSGIYIGSTTAPGPHDCMVINCTAYSNGTDTSADHGFYIKYGTTVDGCTSYGNKAGGFKTNCENSPATVYFPTVRNCIATGNITGIVCASNRSKIYNNLVYDNARTSLLFDGYPGIDDGSEIYFNTFVNAQFNGGISLLGTYKGIIIRDNIIVQDAAIEAHPLILSRGTSSLATVAANNTFNNNVYYYNGNATARAFYDASTSSGKNWQEWRGYAGKPDQNSSYLSSLPDFVARYTNLHPAGGGNLNGLGAAITGYGTDKDGNSRADPPTPGCYE